MLIAREVFLEVNSKVISLKYLSVTVLKTELLIKTFVLNVVTGKHFISNSAP